MILAFGESNLCVIKNSDKKLSARIYFNKFGLIRILMSRFKTNDEKVIIESEAMEMFGLHQSDLRELKKNDILHP